MRPRGGRPPLPRSRCGLGFRAAFDGEWRKQMRALDDPRSRGLESAQEVVRSRRDRYAKPETTPDMDRTVEEVGKAMYPNERTLNPGMRAFCQRLVAIVRAADNTKGS